MIIQKIFTNQNIFRILFSISSARLTSFSKYVYWNSSRFVSDIENFLLFLKSSNIQFPCNLRSSSPFVDILLFYDVVKKPCNRRRAKYHEQMPFFEGILSLMSLTKITEAVMWSLSILEYGLYLIKYWPNKTFSQIKISLKFNFTPVRRC